MQFKTQTYKVQSINQQYLEKLLASVGSGSSEIGKVKKVFFYSYFLFFLETTLCPSGNTVIETSRLFVARIGKATVVMIWGGLLPICDSNSNIKGTLRLRNDTSFHSDNVFLN